MTKNNPQLIVALDVDTFEEATALIDSLSEIVDIFKVGSQLFTACGPVVVRHILAKQKRVFLDLKFHDIPNTVANAVKSAVGLSKTVHDVLDKNQEKIETKEGLFMCTVHITGGKEMLRSAVQSATQEAQNIGVRKPLIIGITVLTSDQKADNIHKLVLERALLAKETGLDGVVSSSQEAAVVRRALGDDFVIVTPGIRPGGSEAGDQKRVTTPKEAVRNGSNFLVVGRPIVKAKDPLGVARLIIDEINN